MFQFMGSRRPVARLVSRALAALLVLAAPAAPALLSLPAWPQEGSSVLIAPIAKSISGSGKHKAVIMPLAGPDGAIDALGAYLSQILSRALNADLPELQLLDPKNLHAPAGPGITRESEEQSKNVLRDIAKSGGADICVIGDFAPFQNQLGISLHAYSADDSLISDSYGEIPIGSDIIALASKPLRYAVPSEGIFEAGLGGVSKPECLNCSPSGGSSRSRPANERGVASVVATVGQDGSTRDVEIIESSSARFGSRAKDEIKALKFKAAKAPDGTPVTVRFQMEFAVVELEITVATDGSVSEVRIVYSPSKNLSDRASDTVRKWKLKPATGSGGNPVPVKVPVEITFRLFR